MRDLLRHPRSSMNAIAPALARRAQTPRRIEAKLRRSSAAGSI
jgi:hypothetical protein